MVKAVLLSMEQSIVGMAATMAEKYELEIVGMHTVGPEGAEPALSQAKEANAEIVILFEPQLSETQLKSKELVPVYIKYMTDDIIGISQKAAKLSAPGFFPAVVLYESMLSKHIDAALLRDNHISVYTADKYGSIAAAVEAAAKDGAGAIAGPGEAGQICARLGLPFLAAVPGCESVRTALLLAEREGVIIRRDRLNRAYGSALLRGAFCGVVAVNAKGEIIEISDRAKYLLDCRGKVVIGQYVLNVFFDLEKEVLDMVLNCGEQIFSHITGSRSRHNIVNIEPVIMDGEVRGAIITLQKWEQRQKKAESEQAENETGARHRFTNFTYTSECFHALIKTAKFAAYTDAPILFYGEEGTEVMGLAQSVHNESARYKKSFIEVECNAWGAGRLNELLFGSMKGSSDYGENAKCALEAAEGGTLFLNHIDELPGELQYRICRLIKGQYSQNGDIRKLAANVRVIAATSKNLRRLMSAGEFREDLYYALNVISLEIPPLRDRREDIDDIVDYFVDYFSNLYSKPVHLVSGAYDAMREFDWPGNTYQLENFCQKLILSAHRRNINEAIIRASLNELVNYSAPPQTEKPAPSPEAAAIIETLRANQGSKTKTAVALGISKATLWRKMQKYGIVSDYSA